MCVLSMKGYPSEGEMCILQTVDNCLRTSNLRSEIYSSRSMTEPPLRLTAVRKLSPKATEGVGL